MDATAPRGQNTINKLELILFFVSELMLGKTFNNAIFTLFENFRLWSFTSWDHMISYFKMGAFASKIRCKFDYHWPWQLSNICYIRFISGKWNSVFSLRSKLNQSITTFIENEISFSLDLFWFVELFLHLAPAKLDGVQKLGSLHAGLLLDLLGRSMHPQKRM